MINYKNSEILQILPPHFSKIPEVKAINYAIAQAVKKTVNYASKCSTQVMIDQLPEQILDLMAVENRTQYYDEHLDINIKRTLVKNTLQWFYHAGTPKAVEEMVSSIFGNGKVIEWFDYNGKPYHFIIEINGENTDVNHNLHKQLIIQIANCKNMRSHLENVIYRLTGKIPVNITTKTVMFILSKFYPRYNLELLILDDSWNLNGEYSLDGYKAGRTIEFYPARMQVGGAVNIPLTLAAIPTARSHSRQVITNRHRETIRSPTAATMSHKFQLQVTGAATQQTNLRKIDHYKSWYGCQETTKSAATSKTTVKGQPTMARQIVIQSELSQKTSSNFKLKVEKDLWYLNEETLLDGSRRLDADIFHYEL